MGVRPNGVRDGSKFVLSQFKKAQYETLDAMLDDAAAAVEVTLREGVQAAMNRFNRKASGEAAETESDKQ